MMQECQGQIAIVGAAKSVIYPFLCFVTALESFQAEHFRSLVKTRELYESHIKDFPPPYKSKKEYEEFLTSTAAMIAANRTGISLWSLPDENSQYRKDMKPALDLQSSYSTAWWKSQRSLEAHNRRTSYEQTSETFAILQRVVFALIGGLALIVPMLIMKLYSTTLNVCLTTTLFVIAVSIVLAISMSNTSPKDLLGITAAYAAVLVVFVGTSTTSSGASNVKVAVVTGSVVGGILVILLAAAYLIRRDLIAGKEPISS